MNTNKETGPVEIYGGTIVQAGMVKSILENAGINAFLKDEFLGTLGPWWIAPGGAGAVKVVVSNLDFDKAKTIVDEFEKNISNE